MRHIVISSYLRQLRNVALVFAELEDIEFFIEFFQHAGNVRGTPNFGLLKCMQGNNAGMQAVGQMQGIHVGLVGCVRQVRWK